MSHIKNLEERIEYNNKIMNKYLEEANNNINYKNLLDLSSTIEDIYDNKLNEFNLIINDIKNIYKFGIEELRKNYLDDFNKKYNFNQCKIVDEAYIGFRNTSLLNIILEQVTFNELCRIDFKNIHELELRFEDYIDINVLTKVTYHNISFLGLSGKIKDITTLSKLPFKLLTTLRLSLNDFYDTNIDIFSNMPFNKLQILLLDNNKINNIIGLTKAPFYELTNLNLDDNKISNLKPILEFPFKKLDKLTLDNNCIEELFKAFRENDLILSDLVNNIYKELEKELSKIENSGKSLNDLVNEIIACKNDYFKDNENEIKSLEKLGNMIVTEDIGHYDCHIPDKIKLMKLENKI